MSYLKGSRVGAILSRDAKALNFLGFGVYEGDIIPEVDGKPILPFPNPCILLDSGKRVYGCECWWGSEEKIKEMIKKAQSEGASLVEADIDLIRAQQDRPAATH